MFEAIGSALRAYANKDGRGYPDWAMRYAPVVRELGEYLERGGRILEIGGNENGLARFADVRPVVVDFALSHLKAAREKQTILPVAADITALPFRDASVDACVCMDTFEHLTPIQRELALVELARVAGTDAKLAVSFPSGRFAERAEARIRAAYRAYTGNEFRWLAEHAAHGLPDGNQLASTAQGLFGTGTSVRLSKNANLAIWTWMWRVLICGWPGRGNALFQALLRLMTPLLTHCHFGRCYRSLLWIEKRHG